MRTFHLISLAAVALFMAACAQPPSSPEVVDESASAALAENVLPRQNELCEVSSWQHDVASEHCEPGQKVIFAPKRWGNEQLPVVFAAVNCDMRYSIALTHGAVTCIYLPLKVDLDEPQPTSPEPTDPPSNES